MEQKNTKRNVFNQLLATMVAFGLFIGLCFPFAAKAVLHAEHALSPQFFGLCLGAGLLVGLVNYLLFHLVISKELGRIITGMRSISSDIREALQQDNPPDHACELEVNSNDQLGEVVMAFNSMGRTIDERQRQERKLRELMNTLSDCVDLTFIGQVILSHIPYPPAWQHILLYVLIEDTYQCIAVKNIDRRSVPERLSLQDLGIPSLPNQKDFISMDAGESVFNALELVAADTIHTPAYITISTLKGNELPLAFTVRASYQHEEMDTDEQKKCLTFCDHVEPYLRHALLHTKTEKQATIDGLSKALNRRAGMERLLAEYSSDVRHKLNLSLIMLDIDHFKKVNDIYGHQAGDMVIRELSRRMLDNLRDEDILFRYGGEEFVVILPHIDLKGAALCAERIRLFIREEPFNAGLEELEIRISLGVVSWPDTQANDPDMLNNLADKALYQAKHQGRDRAVLYTGTKTVSYQEYMTDTPV